MNDIAAIPEWPQNRAVATALESTLAAVGIDKPEEETTTLVLLSGGIDSVAVLANVLEHTAHRVHAHHVELANRDERVQAENDAVAEVVDYCWRRYRDFSFSTSGSEFRITPKGYDLIITMFHAALVCLGARRRTDFVMTGHFRTSKLRALYGQQMLDSCFVNPRMRPRWLRPLDLLPDPATAKVDIYRSVPPDLAELGWSCRHPVAVEGGFEPCGSCYACRNLEAARGKAQCGAARERAGG